MPKKFDTSQVEDFLSIKSESKEQRIAEETQTILQALRRERGEEPQPKIEEEEPAPFFAKDRRFKEPDKVRCVRFSMVMTQNLRDDLKALSYIKGMKSDSDLVHSLLEEAVEKHRAEIDRLKRNRR